MHGTFNAWHIMTCDTWQVGGNQFMDMSFEDVTSTVLMSDTPVDTDTGSSSSSPAPAGKRAPRRPPPRRRPPPPKRGGSGRRAVMEVME